LGIIRTDNITKNYGDHCALRNVSIDVPEKSIFGLLGPNGAGKTTLIRIITQIIAADSGGVYIDEAPLSDSHIPQIGYLPEERGLYKKMKVGEHLLYLARLRGLSRSDAYARMKDWLQKFDIDGWWNKKVEDLSKGMQQKIQFIATVLHRPKIIILDEPFSGFDPINVNLLKDEILKLRAEGSTIIFSTHRMESVEELCDYIVLINRSEKILEGEKHKIKDAFKTNTFVVDHLGNMKDLEDGYEIISSTSLGDQLVSTTIQIPQYRTPNDLLSSLIGKVEIHGFTEKIPSMNEIFISQVKESTNE